MENSISYVLILYCLVIYPAFNLSEIDVYEAEKNMLTNIARKTKNIFRILLVYTLFL